MAKAGITLLENGSTFPSTGLPDPPTIDPKYLLENWLKDIDTSFVNPDPDIDLRTKSGVYEYKISDAIKKQMNKNLQKERQYKKVLRLIIKN
jgi:hypothetical protein